MWMQLRAIEDARGPGKGNHLMGCGFRIPRWILHCDDEDHGLCRGACDAGDDRHGARRRPLRFPPRLRTHPTPASTPAPEALAPGTIINAHNAAQYTQLIPAAAMLAIQHGLRLEVQPTHRIQWSNGFSNRDREIFATGRPRQGRLHHQLHRRDAVSTNRYQRS